MQEKSGRFGWAYANDPWCLGARMTHEGRDGRHGSDTILSYRCVRNGLYPVKGKSKPCGRRRLFPA